MGSTSCIEVEVVVETEVEKCQLIYLHFLVRLLKYPFFIKLLSWEYWPTAIVHAPTMLMWLWFAVKSKALFFFTRANPVIETGGVLGESKINILNRIPSHFLPKTIFINRSQTSIPVITQLLSEKGMTYPLIAKPNIGERGFLVEKLTSEEDLRQYLDQTPVDFLIQEFISLPIEISVLYYRLPTASTGHITSLCIKETLKVKGDGQSTVEELMQAYPRAILQLARFRKKYPAILKHIPEKGSIVELEPIGNHSRGTTFLNGNHHIDDQLVRVFDTIGFQMDDIYYGRFDMKCASMAKLKAGKDFKILEFNGIASEPAHIYQPGYSIFKAYRDLWQHWKIIFQISQEQKQKGIPAMSWKEWTAHHQSYRQYLKAAES